MTAVTWRKEFPADYAVPPEVEALVDGNVVCDTSWHNNACPSFGVVGEDGVGVELWVEHPDPTLRQCSTTRYFVVDLTEDGMHDGTVFHTDVVADAIEEFQRRHAEISIFLTITPEGEEPFRTTLRQFRIDNADEQDGLAAVRALADGEAVTLGGGAAPSCTIQRIQGE